MRKHLNLKVYGRVIGVGFRWSAREQAARHNIAGFIRNADRDYVYIEAEGEEQDVERFLAWCRKGPFWAKVEKVDIEEAGVIGYKEFEVKGD